MGGSSGGGRQRRQAAPPQAEPLNVGAIMGAASAGATAQIGEQYKQLIENYPKMEELSFGTVQRLAGNLDNQTTRDAQGYIRRALEMGDLDPQAADPTSIEEGLYSAGERALNQAPTQIESSLLNSAQSELALGRGLSAEQQREATQAARSAMAARGLGTSAAGTAAEILNRDAYGRQRELERRAFAVDAENYATRRERERQGFAAAANNQYINGITQRRLNLANLYSSGAGNLIAADPYSRAVGPGLGLGMQTQGNQMSQISSTFNSANQLAGDVASFNANMLDSRYNSYMNNRTALQAARIGAGAMNNAATMGMIGSLGSGLIQAGGMVAAAPLMFSDRRMKTDIKPIGTTGDVLGLTAYQYRYKDDASKAVHTGFIAQEVAEVLPEAVETVDYFGKKRLVIKPQVIGQALAEALMRDPTNKSENDEEEDEDSEKCPKCGKKMCKECGAETNDGEMED